MVGKNSKQFLLTTNEPHKIKELFKDMSVETPMDFDMLLYTRHGTVGIERKDVPGDLIASVTDGRLQKELLVMREQTDFQVILFHGRFVFRQGLLVTPGSRVGRSWTERGIRNLKRTLEHVEGLYIEQAETDDELVERVKEIQTYFDELHHLSLKKRPQLESNWYVTTRQEKVRYFYAGLPGISTIRAKALEGKYPNPIDIYAVTVEDLMSIEGIGEKTATNIYNFLRGVLP